MQRAPRRSAALLRALGAAAGFLLGPGCSDAPRFPPPGGSAASASSLVELSPASGELRPLLAAEAARAAEAGLQPVAYLHASWCAPCVALDRTRDDPRMKAAFAGTHVIRLDVDGWGDALEAAGLSSRSIPVFHKLAADGRPTGASLDGGAWGANVPARMAPPLRAFFSAQR